jgi:hypothetical protein
MSSMIQSRLLARALVQNRTRRHMRWVAITLAALALPAVLLAGCSGGGSTFPGAYQCTAPQHPVGCATAITFTHSHINPDSNPDIAGNPVGVYSQVLVVPLTCDASWPGQQRWRQPARLHQQLCGVIAGERRLFARGLHDDSQRYAVLPAVPGARR